MFSERLLERLSSATSVAALTGAGISAESGVPTFRGNEGLWKKFKAEELASFDGFIRNPDLVWEWYSYRKKLIAEVEPNAGHYALADMEKLFQAFAVITQNIDNLHQRAGSTRVYELHGNIERNYCINCGRRYSSEELASATAAPHCVACNGLIRPDVVWFGELLPVDQWEAADRAARGAHVFLSVGTSAIVYPAAGLPLTAREAGAYIVEINMETTPLSGVADETLIGKAGEILPRLVNALRGQPTDKDRK
jgi:NAD-dependent deacetylase